MSDGFITKRTGYCHFIRSLAMLAGRPGVAVLALLLSMVLLQRCPSSSTPNLHVQGDTRGSSDARDAGLDGVLPDMAGDLPDGNASDTHSGVDAVEVTGAELSGELTLPDTNPSIGQCCASSGDCGELSRCIVQDSSQAGGPAPNGICAQNPDFPRCYDDTDCLPGARCEGASWCLCDQACEVPAIPGWCIAPESGCCGSDDDCIGSGDCIMGQCLSMSFVGAGLCWHDADCESGQECVGEQICPCGYVCPWDSTQGRCEEVGPECCGSDSDCAGLKCVRENPASPGVCGPQPTAGTCYSNKDCAPGTACGGSTVCQCAESCVPVLGTCSACCLDSSSCEEGDGCFLGLCRPLPAVPRCWSESDCTHDPNCSGEGCATKFDCQGETLCPCGTYCPTPDSMGWCLPLDVLGPDCCTSDEDCWKGTICVLGKCLIPVLEGACWQHTDCDPGEQCVGAEVQPCGQYLWSDFLPKVGWCGGAAKCCSSDADCPLPLVCAGTDQTLEMSGQCRAPTEATNDCWADSECASGFECVGVVACGCEPFCSDETSGFCEKKPVAPCCASGAECPEGHRCIGLQPGKQNGRCVEVQEWGACYQDSDCGNGQCIGEVVCSCESSCSPQPGSCAAGAQCCTADGDCEDAGDVCVGGKCKASLPDGACWDDLDCSSTGILVCLGAFVCPCNQSCSQNDHAGVCGPKSTDSCCGSANQCGEGEKCLFSDSSAPQGRCYAPAEYPECWGPSDCEEGAVCWDVLVCGCNELGCSPNKGICLAFETCCALDQECQVGEECVHPEGQPTLEGTCKALPQAGGCWNSDYCPPGKNCHAAKVCPCGAICLAEDSQGTCQ